MGWVHDVATRRADVKVWVLGEGVDDALFERLGDCRRAADSLRAGVGVLVAGAARAQAEALVARGADQVRFIPSIPGPGALVGAAAPLIRGHAARLVVAGGDCTGREWAARLAARLRCRLVSPALLVSARDGELEVTALDASGRLARAVRIAAPETVIVTLRAGVGEALAADSSRTGDVVEVALPDGPEPSRRLRLLPADPATVDIRYAGKIVAGGRGLGGKEGFDRLRRFAARIGAGVAASRMAVDLGWIGHERQVGQTGKSVSPDLYIACGISGASHHLDGIAGAGKIVAINTDPAAPIFKVAHLGLVADLFSVLEHAEAELGAEAEPGVAGLGSE
jgi:electron transfer flavoprotein alpha subunit